MYHVLAEKMPLKNTMESFCLFIIIIFSVAVNSGVCDCGRVCDCDREESYNATVEWKCGNEEQNHTKYCKSLNDALDCSATLNQTALCPGVGDLDVSIYLNSHFVTLGKNESSASILGVSQWSLIGAQNSTVDCNSNGARLEFRGAVHAAMSVKIQNITFYKCGNGTAALFFSGNYCNVTLSHLVLEQTNGSGISFENIFGNVSVHNSTFKNNYIHSTFGAGVYMKISSALTRIRKRQPSTMITFTHCNFTGNQVFKNKYKDMHGGGMSLVLGGATENVSVNITHCHFSNNDAQRGAGLYSSFTGHAKNNDLMILNTTFEINNYSSVDTDYYNAGGGAFIITKGRSSLNTLHILNCDFSNNQATWGGALALFASPILPISSKVLNTYIIAHCRFSENRAEIGSAITLYCKSSATAPEFCNTMPTIRDSNFTSNGHNVNISSRPTTSTVNIDGFATHMNGTLNFIGNIGSPLYVHETAVIMGDPSALTFFNNTAQIGGAISLYDSWMTVSRGSRLNFSNNTAFMDGGAIYAHLSKELYVPESHNCFIRYSSNTMETPWTWDSVFDFVGNIARNRTNSIYATSIIPCVWENSSSSDDLKATFCNWSNWTFDNRTSKCIDHISTSIRNFSTTPNSVRLSPGKPKQFIVGVDDLGHNVSKIAVIPVFWPPDKMSKNYSMQYTDEGFVVSGPKNSNITVLIQVDGNNLVMTVNVMIGDCPPGFIYSSESSSCTCYENKRSFLRCHGRIWKASLMSGFCMSSLKIQHTNQTVYGRCLFTGVPRKHDQSHYIPLPEDERSLETFCADFNRTGLLCGTCMEGLCIDVFSTTYNCHNSSSPATGWTVFLAVGGLPPLVLFMVILLLHISLTGGATNGFIFFSQVVTLSQEVLTIKAAIENIHGAYALMSFTIDLYSIWSLDNYRIYHSFTRSHPLCLGENLRVIDVLALHYLSAVYPFALIVVAYFVIELHARNCRVFVCLWKPLCLLCARFRQTWKAQTSVVDAFATFIILSYVKLVRISLLLVTFTDVIILENGRVAKRVSNYDPTVEFLSAQHMPYVLLGSFFLLTFGLLPPLLLLFYQFRTVQRCLDRCKMNRLGLKTFMDAFQGCYKDGRDGGPDRRFFAGLYLVFRVAIFSIFNLQIPHTITFFSMLVACIIIAMSIAFLQPYKVRFYNNLDIFFTCLLAVFFGFHVLGYSYLESTLKLPVALVILSYCVGIIPLLYMMGLVVVKTLRLFGRSQCFTKLRHHVPIAMRNLKKHNQLLSPTSGDGDLPSTTTVTYSEVAPDDDIPDRLANSFLYRSISISQASVSCKKHTKTNESGYGSIN